MCRRGSEPDPNLAARSLPHTSVPGASYRHSRRTEVPGDPRLFLALPLLSCALWPQGLLHGQVRRHPTLSRESARISRSDIAPGLTGSESPGSAPAPLGRSSGMRACWLVWLFRRYHPPSGPSCVLASVLGPLSTALDSGRLCSGLLGPSHSPLGLLACLMHTRLASLACDIDLDLAPHPSSPRPSVLSDRWPRATRTNMECTLGPGLLPRILCRGSQRGINIAHFAQCSAVRVCRVSVC